MARNSDELPTLVAQSGPLNGQRFSIENTALVGRETSCNIVIPDRQVSRYHARFSATPEGMQLEDLGSKNGTHCNGQLLSKPIILQDGDLIQISLVQQFLYLGSDATATIPLEPSVGEPAASPIQIRRLRLEKRSRRVWIDEEEVLPPLSASQYGLLELLYDHQDRVITRKEVIVKVWGDEYAIDVSEQALDALVRRLRDRLATIDPTHVFVVTVRGHGLRLDNPISSAKR
jgi:DNA-binding winged helix-turn-helix (wHTH) protein